MIAESRAHLSSVGTGPQALAQLLDINADIEQSGAVWQEESYDRIIRDEEHLYRVVQYVGRNPSQGGLPRTDWYRWLHPDWEACGWKFEDAASP
ncbi:MAG: hypothetical protein JSS49_17755 [Planctomycetes bacterium]|nr:hypothetical protein [Planctomycetota bacterium]